MGFRVAYESWQEDQPLIGDDVFDSYRDASEEAQNASDGERAAWVIDA
jgi:hypothetical protein